MDINTLKDILKLAPPSLMKCDLDKPLEYRTLPDMIWHPLQVGTLCPTWEYRNTPEPEYVPYSKFEASFVGRKVKFKRNREVTLLIVDVDATHTTLSVGTYRHILPEQFFGDFVWEDGSPCGELKP